MHLTNIKKCDIKLYKILKNERYAGTCTICGEVFENLYPRIVPQELYDSVRQKIDANKYGKQSVEVVYLLKHKVRCGYCGQPISADSGTSMNGEVKRYYKCRGRKIGGSCHKQPIRKDVLENLVIDKIIEQLQNPKIMKTIIDGLLLIQEQQIKDSPILNALLHEKQKADNALHNLVAAIERGIMSNTTNKRLHELEAQQEDLERQILVERSRQTTKVTEETIREFYTQALKLEPKMLITYLVKEIVLFDDRIEIYFNSPLTISPDDSQGFSFYSEKIIVTYKIPQRTQSATIKLEMEMFIQ